MHTHAFVKTLLFASCAAGLYAQAPAPKLSCDRVALVIPGLTTACDLRELTVDSAPSLAITNAANGGVSVYTWDGPQTLVRALVLTAAATEWQAQALAWQVQLTASFGELHVTGPSININQNWSASLEIYVPAVTVLRVSTLNGGVTIEGVSGDINASTVNGGVTVAGATGNVTASAVNGGIDISVPAPWNNQTIAAKGVNGGIEIGLPSDTSAHVQLATTNGQISTTLPAANWTVSGRKGTVSFDLGSGISLVSATTVNGGIKLRGTD